MRKNFILVVLIFISFIAFSQEKDLDSLYKKIEELEKRVEQINESTTDDLPDYQEFTRGNIEALNLTPSIKGNISGVELSIGGFVQTDFILDSHRTSNRYGFQNSAIDMVNRGRDGQLTFSTKQTRLTFTSKYKLDKGEIFTLFEMDFFNLNGAYPEIRHAYGEINGFGVGMYWSNFMEIEAFPNLLDYWGPSAMVFSRPIQIRYKIPLKNDKNRVVISLEQQTPDLNYENTDYQKWFISPNLVASYRRDFNQSFVKAAMVLHPITYESSTDEKYNKMGWGINVASNLYTKDNSHFSTQITFSDGSSSYYNDLGGSGYDGYFDPSSGNLTTFQAFAFMAFYNHWFSKDLSASIGWAYLDLLNTSNNDYQVYDNSNYGSVNCIYYPWKTVKIGIEFIYGDLNYTTGVRGKNSRIQSSFMFKF